MIKIISGPNDHRYFNTGELYRVYEMREEGTELVALATTVGEALDARAMLVDLTRKQYTISPPDKLAN